MTRRTPSASPAPRRAIALLIAALTVSACPLPARAQQQRTGNDLVKAQLIADVAAVEPGGRFTLGLLLKIQPHWHVYWLNSGDVGLPTSVKFTAPPGFNFAPMQWPLPFKFDQPGGLVAFGYEDQVLLMAPVVAPAALKPGQSVTIDAAVNWLVCREVCLKGGDKLSLTLAIKAKAESANQPLFTAWRKRLPVRPDILSDVALPSAGPLRTFSPHPDDTGRPADALTLTWSTAPASVEWFPAASNALAVKDVTVEHTGRKTVIRFKSKVYLPDEVPTGVIDSIVVYTDAAGHRRGVIVPIRVLPAS